MQRQGRSWLTLQGKRRGYGRDISDLAPLFPVQTSHAKSYMAQAASVSNDSSSICRFFFDKNEIKS